jgi:hypothetical protein
MRRKVSKFKAFCSLNADNCKLGDDQKVFALLAYVITEVESATCVGSAMDSAISLYTTNDA